MKAWVNPVSMKLVATSESESFADMPEGVTGLPLAPHPGAFGVVRKNHTHEGVDIYVPDESPVMAVEDGIVVAIIDFTGPGAAPPSPWWHDTKALLVQGDSGVVVYGEIIPEYHFWEGDHVKAGEIIGRVTPVLKKDMGRPMTMLHLELHRHGTKDAYEWPVEGPRPESLLDPTVFLMDVASR